MVCTVCSLQSAWSAFWGDRRFHETRTGRRPSGPPYLHSVYGDDANRVYSSQRVVADQLSVERGVNALFELSNGFTPEEQLEGLHLEIADWHAGNKFLKV